MYVFFVTVAFLNICIDVQPGITTCEIEFVWCGAFYKHLVITADLVPAIRVKSWPKFARTESGLLTQDITKQGCHVPKTEEAVNYLVAKFSETRGCPQTKH